MKRAGSPIPSSVSKKRSRSTSDLVRRRSSSEGGASDAGLHIESPGSSVSSCLSMKSDQSMGVPFKFSSGGGEPSRVSMEGDQSMGVPFKFSSGGGEPSRVSMEGDQSMGVPFKFSSGGGEPSRVSMKSYQSMGVPFKFSSDVVPFDPEQRSTEAALQTLPRTLTGTGDLQHPVGDNMQRVLERHKTSLKSKHESLFEGIRTEENKTLLNKIYTQLYIIEGESKGVNEEHEFLQMVKTHRKHLQDTPINCVDIFKSLQDPNIEMEEKANGGKHKEKQKEREKDRRTKTPHLRTVLTTGIAGIGKTVTVQKFILDWAEGKANQDVDFMFVLSFRELNLIKDDEYSLHGLLCDFHPELKDLDPERYYQHKTVFILDGLDESRIPLNFSQSKKVSDITMKSSVDVLLTNLVKGELLPSALIWITSRPAAANQIPPQYIDRVTEIQGFNEPQKEEYFRKRINDQDQAEQVISHIKTVRSLRIMCHIPVFCWISATVLQKIMKQHTMIPKTLTEIYSHFLLTQTTMKNVKYEEKDDEGDPKKNLESNRTILLKLSELAFKQLMKGNVMFYEEDLRESGIDVTEASVYSGIFTEIFREECVFYQRKIYCFVHLSFQEFLAAVYVFHCYENKNMEALQFFKPSYREWPENLTVDELLKEAVDKTLKIENGLLDLFLRFLLGISLDSNQRLLQGLLTPTGSSSENFCETVKYILKQIQGGHLPVNRSINLFFCLFEMKNKSLCEQIKDYIKSDKQSEMRLSPEQCSSLVCMLLTSDKVLDELDLKKYNTTPEGYRRLIPAVSVCRKAILAGCCLTKGACETLRSTLQSADSSLRELNLGNNNLQDSEVELLSAALKSSQCELEKLSLDVCNLGDKACKNLGLVLQASSSLKEVDLSNNDLQDSGVALLSAGLKSSHCKLEILRLSGCMVTEEGCSSLVSALKSNPSHLRELDLTYNNPGEFGMKLLSDLLEDSRCTLDTLRLENGGEIMMKPGLKKYAFDLTLDPNTAHTRLSLSEGNRKVENAGADQPYPGHPDRFEHQPQVLSVESLTGRCYWEAEWSGERVTVSVSYRRINRKGDGDCVFGNNEESWRLNCDNNCYFVCHNNKRTLVSDPPSPSPIVGVYLDWQAGTLSFYSVSPDTQTLTHLHTFNTEFTEPLYAGFWVGENSRVCVRENSEYVEFIMPE